MLLCHECGRVDEHSNECSRHVRIAADERAAAVQKAMQEARAELSAIEKLGADESRSAIVRLLGLERLLERQSARHLSAFDAKRAHADLVTKIGQRRKDLEATAPGGDSLADEFAFAKRVVEASFSLAARSAEAERFDASALSKLTVVTRVETAGRPLGDVVDDVEKILANSRDLDKEVATWGWKNLRPLVTGREPAEVPAAMLASGGLGSVFGALMGRGPETRRANAVTKFKLLGDQFRERLYLLAANVIVMKYRSRLSQAEDSHKRVLNDEGRRRWEKIQSESPDLVEMLVGVRENADAEIARLGRDAPKLAVAALRPFDALDTDELDVLAKAYFFVFASIMGGHSSRDIGMESVAHALLEERKDVPRNEEQVAQILQHVRDSWRARPPSEYGSAPAEPTS